MEDLLVRFARKTKSIVKRSQPLALVAGLLAGIVASSLPMGFVGAKNLTPTPRVSFTFDDGLKSSLTEAAPTLAKYNFTGTNYVITDCVGTVGTCAADPAAEYMTWAEIASLDAAGWEIGSHTASHPQLDTDGLTQPQVNEQMAKSKAALIDHGYTADAFAAPYGDYSNMVRAEAAKFYSSFRGFHDIDYNTFPYDDQLIVVQQVQDGVTVEQVKGYVNTAKQNNQWLVLVFHDIKQQSTGNPEDYQYSTANLDAIAQYVNEQNVAVTNMTDGLAKGDTNLLLGGSFAETSALGSYTGVPSVTEWTTSDPDNIKIDTSVKGSYPEAEKSVIMNAGTANNYLFSPLVGVDSSQTYVLKNFLNVEECTSGELGYYIHEYDSSGNELYGDGVGGQWKKAITKKWVENTNIVYTPSNTNVKNASIEVYVTANSGIKAYVDNFQWYSTSEVSVPVDNVAPVVTAAVDPNADPVYVSWKTNEPFTSVKIEFGATTEYGTEVSYDLLGNEYVSSFGTLAPGTYYYRITATDAAGNSGEKVGSFTVGSVVEPLAGDVNGDGVVGIEDATKVALNWGMAGASRSDGDVTGDGEVTIEDATMVALNWSEN